MDVKHIQHLYWRAGFGVTQKKLQKLQRKTKEDIVSSLFEQSENYQELKIDLVKFDELRYGNYKELRNKLGLESVKSLKKESRNEVRNLNLAWIDRLKNTDAILVEKMTLFWANVFVCKDQNVWNIQNYNNVLRTHALGHFGDFVKAIAHEPSMIDYLNNKQNKKHSPNENFARELMELFTLGAGNYTENDIKESARAFTGWTYKRRGSFTLNKKNHDFGKKTFFGETGHFDGNDIVDIILKQKQCARFICSKIYAYFVNPTINKKRLEELTTVFYKDYNIENLMLYIFKSKWFYADENIGVKIKSPIELMVGIYQIVPYSLTKKKQFQYLQKMMGQILLYPVNVAGWKGGKNWIDSNTLMFRLKLPSIILNNALINLDEKGDIEGTFEKFYNKSKKKKQYLKTEVFWSEFEKEYKNISPEDLKKNLILSAIHPDTSQLLSNLKVESIKDYCIQLMSIPEYQLC
jgi:hypothetical protein